MAALHGPWLDAHALWAMIHGHAREDTMAFKLDDDNKLRRAQKKPKGLGVFPLAIMLAILVAGSWYVGFILQKEFNVQAYDLLNPYPSRPIPAPLVPPSGPTDFNG
jgi:hypothetical protein